MEILLDTASIEQIKEVLKYYPIDGFTTNPSILAKSENNVGEIIREFKELLSPTQTIHIQTTAKKADDMLKQAKLFTEYFGSNFYIKIPITNEGIKALGLIKTEGLKSTATAIFTAAQALLAAKAGANYVAPYINRIDNISGKGTGVVRDIIVILKHYNYTTRVLGASFKNTQQISDLAIAGCHAATLTPDLIDTFVNHPYTVKSLNDFDSSWERKFKTKEVIDFIP